jgi:hypothetical protein
LPRRPATGTTLTQDSPSEWRKEGSQVTQLDRFYAWKLPRNLHFITDYLDLVDGPNNEVAHVEVTDRPTLQRRLGSERDDVEELFRPFFRDLLSLNKDMFVDIASWNRLVEKKKIFRRMKSPIAFSLSQC